MNFTFLFSFSPFNLSNICTTPFSCSFLSSSILFLLPLFSFLSRLSQVLLQAQPFLFPFCHSAFFFHCPICSEGFSFLQPFPHRHQPFSSLNLGLLCPVCL